MENSIDKMVAIVLVVILLAVAPMFQVFFNVDKTAQNQVSVLTNNFQKEVRNRGFIDKETFDIFNEKLVGTGRIYKVSMVHKRLAYYPLENEKKFLEGNIAFKEDIILDVIYNKKQVYKMNKGDEFTVLVEEMEGSTKGSRMFFGYFQKDTKYLPKLFARFGGKVENF